jgi:hypothetical protein
MALKFVRRLKANDKQVRVLLGAFWHAYRTVYRGVYVTGTMDPSPFTSTQLRSARTFHRLTPRLISTLGDDRIRVDLIGQATSVPADPPACSGGNDPYACALPRKVALPREQLWQNKFRDMVRQLPAGSRVINNFTGTYCSRTKCKGFADDVYTYFDPTHLSASRTETFRRFFAPTFRWAN